MSVETPSSVAGSLKHSSHKDRARSSHETSKKRKRNEREGSAVDDARSATPSPQRKRHKSEVSPEKSQRNRQRQRKSISQSSPFAIQTISLYLPLPPITQSQPLEGLCAEHLSPLLLTYYPPVKGVVLAYINPRLSNDPQSTSSHPTETVYAKSIDEYAASYVWMTVDMILVRPGPDAWIDGYVNLQNESHLGLLCYNQFNASIDGKRLPTDWQWSGMINNRQPGGHGASHNGLGQRSSTEMEASFLDGNGKRVEGLVRFRFLDLESMSAAGRRDGFVTIEGTMLTEEEEQKQAKEARYGERSAESEQDGTQNPRGREEKRKGKTKISSDYQSHDQDF